MYTILFKYVSYYSVRKINSVCLCNVFERSAEQVYSADRVLIGKASRGFLHLALKCVLLNMPVFHLLEGEGFKFNSSSYKEPVKGDQQRSYMCPLWLIKE